MNVKLSILIPSLPERIDVMSKIVEEVTKQSQGKPVEVLVMLDNKKRTIGAKRNSLIEQAKGEYVVFVDDDDRVVPHFVEALCSKIEAEPDTDCIVYDVAVNLNGKFSKICKYGKEYRYGQDAFFYYRKPNSRMCYAKRIAEKHKFLDINYGEDDEWGERASRDIGKQSRIPDVLYHYDYVDKPASWWQLSE